MYKNRRKTISSQSNRDSEYEAFKINEFLSRQRRESLSSVEELNNSDFTCSQRMLFATLLTNPDKRAKVFELLTNEGLVPKDENLPFNNQLSGKKKGDRVKLLSQEGSTPPDKRPRKFKFESPSSRVRRIQLEELCKRKKGGNTTPRASSEDESFEPLPLDQILKGVVAYCEVRSNEEDRSELIKRALQCMGAEVVDALNTKRITHVVYRDGSYKTFERARLLKAKLVSVLWIEACRKKGRRVNESRYPAFGVKAPEFDLTDVCGRLKENIDSDSISLVSLSSDSSSIQESGVVPATQTSQNSTDLNHLSYANVTTDISPRRSDDLGNQVRNSFELKKVQHIKSPENQSLSKKRQSSVIDEDDSIELHMTSDASKSRISENNDESKRSSGAVKRRKSSTNSLSNVNLNQKDNSLSKIVLNESKITKRKPKTKKDDSSDFYITDKSLLDSSKVPDKGPKSTNSSQNGKKSNKKDSNSKRYSGSNRKITDFLQNANQKDKTNDSMKPVESVETKNKNLGGAKSSLETEGSFHLHITSDDSKTRSSIASNPAPIDNSTLAVSKTNENTTLETTKPKRRRLYNPANIDLDNLNLRWSQEPKETKIDLPKTSKKYCVERPPHLKTPRELTSKATKFLKNKNKSTTSTSSCSSGSKEKDNRKKQEGRKSLCVAKTKILETSSELSDEPVKKVEEPKVAKPEVDRRKSLRNVTKKQTPVKSTSSEEYYSLDVSKSDEKDTQKKPEPQIKGQNIRKKLWDTPEKQPTKELINTPRRSTRISIMRTPSHNLVSKNVLNESKSVDRVKTAPKTPKPIPKSNKKAPKPKVTPRTQRIQKAKENGEGDGEVDDEILSSNMSRVLDKLIAKEVCERRSTFEFENPTNNPTQLKPVIKDKEEKKYGTIVCTRLHRQQTEVFIAVVRKLGKFSSHEDEVTKNTTHLVAGDTGRTINLLRAITRGCWIVRHEWLLRSAEAGQWLPEKDYELTEFSSAVQFSRMERDVFGKNYKMNILQGKSVWVTAGSTPRKSDLQELIELVGGKNATAPRKADLIIGECMPSPAPTCVAETWLLECISKYKFMPYEPYILQGPSTN